jgi:hypothetical protein
MQGETNTPTEELSLGPTEIIGLTRRELLGLNKLPPIREYEYAADPRVLKRRIAGILLATTTLMSLNVEGLVSADISNCPPTDIACYLNEAELAVPVHMRAGPIETSMTTTATTLLPTTTLPPESIPPPPPPETLPPPPESIAVAASNPEITPASPEVVAAIEAMQLTPEGYQQFLAGIDPAWFDYAQGHANFNPARVSDPSYAGDEAIAQNSTEFVTAHYTASFTNPDGPGQEPVGEMDVQRLIDFMANRGNPCCAVNFLIDRNGHTYQLAPFQAKLRHNPPYDTKTVGFEVESAYQPRNTAQYEAMSYLTIAILQNEGLLSARPLTDIFKGHGEMRDAYRHEHPGTGLDQRNDFDQPVMDVLRPKIDAFLQANPNIAELTTPLR